MGGDKDDTVGLGLVDGLGSHVFGGHLKAVALDLCAVDLPAVELLALGGFVCKQLDEVALLGRSHIGRAIFNGDVVEDGLAGFQRSRNKDLPAGIGQSRSLVAAALGNHRFGLIQPGLGSVQRRHRLTGGLAVLDRVPLGHDLARTLDALCRLHLLRLAVQPEVGVGQGGFGDGKRPIVCGQVRRFPIQRAGIVHVDFYSVSTRLRRNLSRADRITFFVVLDGHMTNSICILRFCRDHRFLRLAVVGQARRCSEVKHRRLRRTPCNGKLPSFACQFCCSFVLGSFFHIDLYGVSARLRRTLSHADRIIIFVVPDGHMANCICIPRFCRDCRFFRLAVVGQVRRCREVKHRRLQRTLRDGKHPPFVC